MHGPHQLGLCQYETIQECGGITWTPFQMSVKIIMFPIPIATNSSFLKTNSEPPAWATGSQYLSGAPPIPARKTKWRILPNVSISMVFTCKIHPEIGCCASSCLPALTEDGTQRLVWIHPVRVSQNQSGTSPSRGQNVFHVMCLSQRAVDTDRYVYIYICTYIYIYVYI